MDKSTQNSPGGNDKRSPPSPSSSAKHSEGSPRTEHDRDRSPATQATIDKLVRLYTGYPITMDIYDSYNPFNTDNPVQGPGGARRDTPASPASPSSSKDAKNLAQPEESKEKKVLSPTRVLSPRVLSPSASPRVLSVRSPNPALDSALDVSLEQEEGQCWTQGWQQSKIVRGK